MATKKANSKPKSKKNTTTNAPEQSVKSGEIVAICLIALSIFFGISVYSDNGGFLGNAISGVLKGLFGYCAYLLPIIMAVSIIFYLFPSE